MKHDTPQPCEVLPRDRSEAVGKLIDAALTGSVGGAEAPRFLARQLAVAVAS